MKNFKKLVGATTVAVAAFGLVGASASAEEYIVPTAGTIGEDTTYSFSVPENFEWSLKTKEDGVTSEQYKIAAAKVNPTAATLKLVSFTETDDSDTKGTDSLVKLSLEGTNKLTSKEFNDYISKNFDKGIINSKSANLDKGLPQIPAGNDITFKFTGNVRDGKDLPTKKMHANYNMVLDISWDK